MSCTPAKVDGGQLVLALLDNGKRNNAHGGTIEFEVKGGVLGGSFMSANDCY